ncbi:MAG: magnesium/cobalt transporter CorA [Acidobacteria bacterium]|nr:magnesium/cobalt transporter CorA [Acidobacteriota bacterium]
MPRLMKKLSKTRGLMPGTVVFVGDKKIDKMHIRIIDYDATEIEEKTVSSIEECYPFKEKPTITWINIDGLHEVEQIEKIGRHFDIHPLILEDIANTGQRPKLDTFDQGLFIALKMLIINPESGKIQSEQFSFVVGRTFVISFQEKIGDVFEAVRNRIRKSAPRVRFMDSDYLAYTLVDAIVDNYFAILETISEQIEEIETELINDPGPGNLESIHEMKRELIYMRKAVWPLREVIGGLERIGSEFIHDPTRIYLRDLYEHTIQVIDTVETFRDMVSGLLDIYLSSVSNKMNEVMKVLTIIATIFIPLGFLAGIYGMNFDTSVSSWNMPELGMRYGYIFFWLLALLIGGGLFVFFKRKKWL